MVAVRRELGQPRWGAFAGVVYAVIIARAAESPLRVATADPAAHNVRVAVAVAAALVANSLAIRRLRRRKLAGTYPLFDVDWFRRQAAYGVLFIGLLALLLPQGSFFRRLPDAIDTIPDLFSLQLFLGFAMIGLRRGFKLVLIAPASTAALLVACAVVNRPSQAEFTALLTVWMYWSLINYTAGALGRQILIRMSDQSDMAMESAPQHDFEAVLDHMRERLDARQASVTAGVLGVVRANYDRVAGVVSADIAEAADALGVAALALSGDLLTEAPSEGDLSLEPIVLTLRIANIPVETQWRVAPALSLREEAYLRRYIDALAANLSRARDALREVQVMVEADGSWVRARVAAFGEMPAAPTRDTSFHSLLALRALSECLGGSLEVLSIAGAGELVEGRIRRQPGPSTD